MFMLRITSEGNYSIVSKENSNQALVMFYSKVYANNVVRKINTDYKTADDGDFYLESADNVTGIKKKGSNRFIALVYDKAVGEEIVGILNAA